MVDEVDILFAIIRVVYAAMFPSAVVLFARAFRRPFVGFKRRILGMLLSVFFLRH